jgi:hypothetical protein
MEFFYIAILALCEIFILSCSLSLSPSSPSPSYIPLLTQNNPHSQSTHIIVHFASNSSLLQHFFNIVFGEEEKMLVSAVLLSLFFRKMENGLEN